MTEYPRKRLGRGLMDARRPQLTDLNAFDRRREAVRYISFSSGNGGAGVSYISTQFASWLSRKGKNVLFLDVNWSLPSSHHYFALDPDESFTEYLEGRKTLASCIRKTQGGAAALMGYPGVNILSQLSREKSTAIRSDLGSLAKGFEYVLIDIPPGLRSEDLDWHRLSTLSTIVMTPDSLSITCGYALFKNIVNAKKDSKIGILINRSMSPAEGMSAMNTVNQVAASFLDFTPIGLGAIPFDLELLRRPSGKNLTSKALEDSFSNILSAVEVSSGEVSVL